MKAIEPQFNYAEPGNNPATHDAGDGHVFYMADARPSSIARPVFIVANNAELERMIGCAR